LVEGSNRRIYTIDKHLGGAVAGVAADARQLVNRARGEARQYKGFYGGEISTKVLNERLSAFVQAYTLYGNVRPFGTSIILGGYDEHIGPQLYVIEPSGLSWGYFGAAIGKGKQAAKNEIEKLKLANMTCREALIEVARIIYLIHDDVKDKDFELELSWVCDESNRMHQLVPKELKDNAIKLAKAALDEGMEE